MNVFSDGPWKCFNCGRTFSDPVDAANHFGKAPDLAACQMLVSLATYQALEKRVRALEDAKK